MRSQPTRFLDALAASVMAAVPVDTFDPVALANAIGREERAIEEIAAQAGLSAGQTEDAVAEVDGAGYLTAVGMLVQLTPSGARWYAARRGRKGR